MLTWYLYQLPLIYTALLYVDLISLSVTPHIYCIVVCWPDIFISYPSYNNYCIVVCWPIFISYPSYILHCCLLTWYLYQSPLIYTALLLVDLISLSVTPHLYCIVACWPDKCCLSQGKYLYQVIMMLHFLNDVVNDVELTWKSIIMS